MENSKPSNINTRQYLALGDSYTIGEAVLTEERWPVQLVERLRQEAGIAMADPRIIATTGWTTDELLTAIKQEQPAATYELVSLLIGVNNQYRGYAFSQYQTEFAELLQQAIEFAGNRPEHVFVVSIPDYGKTPFGQEKDPAKISEELAAYNAEAKRQAEAKGVRFINITPISEEALNEPALTASDRLHPSGAMYSRWTELIYSDVVNMLN